MATDLIVSRLIFNVAIMFIMMIPGILLKKLRMIPDGFGKGISNLVLYIAQPALILFAFLGAEDRDILQDALAVLLISMVIHAVFAVVAFAVFKKAPDAKRRLLRMTTIFANAAFMGIPLVSAIYAGTPLASRATILASIYNLSFNLFLWSLGVFICTHGRDDNNDGVLDPHIIEKKKDASLLKVLYHPVTIASAIGIIAMCLNLSNTAPAVFGTDSLLGDSLDALRGLVAPLSMLVIGIRLADINFKGFFGDLYMYAALILRHIVLPLATVGIILLVRLLGINVSDVAFTVSLILAATPAASSSTMFAEKFDCDAAYVSRLVAVSTLLSILTMPLILMLVSGAI